jgi:hypothetical protein
VSVGAPPPCVATSTPPHPSLIATPTPTPHPRDWGPGLGAAGIYGGVSLAAYDVALLRSAHVRQVRGPTGFLLRIEPELALPAGGDAGTLVAEIPSLGVRAAQRLDFAQPGRGAGTLELLVPADSVKLWWPSGYGEQPLYEMVVSWTSSKAPDASNPSSTLARRVGFRTVELVERPLSEAAAELLGRAGGWEGGVSPARGVRACAGMGDCGQYGWVDGKKWTFISTEMKPSLDHPISGYDFAGAYPNSSMPGGDNPWWNQKLGVWTGWGAPALAERVEGESMYFKVRGCLVVWVDWMGLGLGLGPTVGSSRLHPNHQPNPTQSDCQGQRRPHLRQGRQHHPLPHAARQRHPRAHPRHD